MLTEQQQAVLARIEPEEVVELARSLIRIPSITGEEGRQCSDFLCDWLREAGFSAGQQQVHVEMPEGILRLTRRSRDELPPAARERYNVFGELAGGRPGKRILLQGHFDTKWVDGMEIDPFGAEIRDGKLYGRGAADMKSALAAMLVAMKALRTSGVPLAGACRFASEVGEEGGGWGIHALDEAGYLAADVAVVGEPTGLEVQIGNRGGYRAEIRVEGRAIHNGLAQQGINAIQKMAPIITGLYSLPLLQKRDPIWGTTSVSVQKIEGGGRWEASVADDCTVWVDYRVTPFDPPEEVERQVRAMLADLAARDPELRAELRPYGSGAAVGISPDEPFVGQARRAVAAVRGESRLGACTGGTAAGVLIRRHGTPAIILGPGSLAQAHGRVEWVEVQQVVDAARIYALLALDVLT